MLKNSFKVLAVLFIALLFNACEREVSHEHQEVRWDRDMCDRCKMIVSERQHAVQVINKETGRAYKFDDLGCAIAWFKEEDIKWKNEAKIWITDVKTSKWIDARTAFYDTDHKTPMGYGFSANEKEDSIHESKALGFEEVSKRILAQGR